MKAPYDFCPAERDPRRRVAHYLEELMPKLGAQERDLYASEIVALVTFRPPTGAWSARDRRAYAARPPDQLRRAWLEEI